VTSYCGRLDQTGVIDLSDPSNVIGTAGYAIVPITIEGLAIDEGWSPSKSEYAMLDTGSTTTVIHPSLINDLKLKQVGQELGGDAETEHIVSVPLYQARITINAIKGGWSLLAMGRSYPYPHLFRVIIGNDILRFCRFALDGPAGSFTLEIPQDR
jgi:hypothetical protein